MGHDEADRLLPHDRRGSAGAVRICDPLHNLVEDLPVVIRSEQEWREILVPGAFMVTRMARTEEPFTGIYYSHHARGYYRCVCCGTFLFSSESKFDSGSGWPSFTDPVCEGNVVTLPDHSLGMVRTEVRCARCRAHLGHLFDDGPLPGRRRFCINSIALRFFAV